jgi:ArsR family transcriptional regulator, lead/cadmium/zinc/bismuth-responsive transcriptional repressor
MAGTSAHLSTATRLPKPALDERPLISRTEADELTKVFKVMASPTRVRLLHAMLRGGSRCVSDLAADVRMKPQAVSNQLQRLVDRGIVTPTREGTRIFYRIMDPCVIDLLDRALCLTEDAREAAR